MSGAARIRLLLVEPDSFLRELLVASLGLHDRRLEITQADEPLGAYEAVLREDLDLIITEASFPGGSSREYLPRLRRLASHLPILVLTAEANEALRASPDLDAVVRKPPEMDHLLHRVDQLLDLQRTSVVRGFALESFVQVLETERKTCTLLV
jgi:DNA-binding response OmpR family regulator